MKPLKSILDRSYKIKYGEWAIADECLVIIKGKQKDQIKIQTNLFFVKIKIIIVKKEKNQW